MARLVKNSLIRLTCVISDIKLDITQGENTHLNLVWRVPQLYNEHTGVFRGKMTQIECLINKLQTSGEIMDR